MTDAELLAAYDAQIRLWVPDPVPRGRTFERFGPILRVTGMGRDGFISTARDLGMDGAELDAAIAEQRDFFAARGESVEWKTRGHDLPESLPARLVAAGFVPQTPESLVLGDAATLATDVPDPGGITIRQTADRDDLARVAALQAEIYGEDWAWLVDDLDSRADTTVLVAEDAGTLVSAAWLVVRPRLEFAGLWGGATLATHRRRGIYRALVARRARLAVERGAKYLQVDASEASRPILERLGLQVCGTTTPYVWTP